MGSGKLIQAAIQKHGLENFDKQILFVFETENEMNDKEAELVTEDFVKEDTNYNLCPGGHGGWGYLNMTNQSNIGWKNNNKTNEHQKKGGHIGGKRTQEIHGTHKAFIIAGRTSFLGKYHTKETKDKIGSVNSKHQAGSGNSQFGTMWITNGQENKKIKKDVDIIPEGWHKGRK